jgi:hypothetical protein
MNNANQTVTAAFVALTPATLQVSGNGSNGNGSSGSGGAFGSAYRDPQAGSPTSLSLTFTATNSGQLPVTITALTVTPGAAPFAVSGMAVPFVLNGNTTQTFTVIFTPGNSANPMGAQSGTLTVSNTANGSVTVPLTGTGLAPKLSINWN